MNCVEFEVNKPKHELSGCGGGTHRINTSEIPKKGIYYDIVDCVWTSSSYKNTPTTYYVCINLYVNNVKVASLDWYSPNNLPTWVTTKESLIEEFWRCVFAENKLIDIFNKVLEVGIETGREEIQDEFKKLMGIKNYGGSYYGGNK